MIILRELQEQDAPFMLEWMHDPDIQKNFKRNMLEASIDDAILFINTSKIPDFIHTGINLHFAIVGDEKEYLGTISLKNIDLDNKRAEYAITMRRKAQGKGIAYEATRLILKKAFFEYGLHRVYLSVYSNNKAAIKLYERCGFILEGEFREHFLMDGNYLNWKWYGILSDEFNEK